MSRTLKIIIGILFYPYGLYLIYLWYRGNKKQITVKPETPSIRQEDQPLVNKSESEDLQEVRNKVETVMTETSSIRQEDENVKGDPLVDSSNEDLKENDTSDDISQSVDLGRNPLVRFIRKLRLNTLTKQLDDIFDDSEDVYKKHKIKYVDWGRGFTRKEKRHNDWVDEVLNKEREKNYEETGIKETDSEREKRENDNKLLKEYQKKYGEEIGERILNEEIWIGMTSEMLVDSRFEPDHKIEKVSKSKKREEYFYGSYKNRLGKYSYKFRVVIIDGKVDGWNDITN